MATTIKQLIGLLSNYNPDAVITNEQLEDFVHIRTMEDQVILSTKKPIGYCNRSGEKVYPSVVKGYSAYSPELDEDLYKNEYTPMEKYMVVWDDETLYTNDENELKEFIQDKPKHIYQFNKKLREYELLEN